MSALGKLLVLKQSESVRLEADRLASLLRRMTEKDAEDIICRAVEELALRLSNCGRCWDIGDLGELRKCARSMIAIAEQIGMTSLASVAGDTVGCLDRGDMVAAAATQARLARIGESSLSTIWDHRDLSGW